MHNMFIIVHNLGLGVGDVFEESVVRRVSS